ncbi:hypothetical protein CDD80_3638 [Ophiocordyceps camponoti-rufipedis]|uniref:Uncharacterized protein n=1 Tax=Ophiocordyceps camponoti-rufipedis TaxID=2004952 RepID=A0A2C5YY41_9HYPO|nr:hypothetical protein CDD80_3638 [Ophiocordyceps camponoti-rufipedis]
MVAKTTTSCSGEMVVKTSNRWQKRTQGQRRSCCGLRRELSCQSISNLTVDFHLGNDMGAGTWDTIAVEVGALRGKSGITKLAREPEGGFLSNHTFDLQSIFGSRTVPLSDINPVRLVDISGKGFYFRKDQWEFGGITLTATCADSSQRIEMTKYRSVNKWLQNNSEGLFNPDQVWEGEIAPSDWSLKKESNTEIYHEKHPNRDTPKKESKKWPKDENK